MGNLKPTNDFVFKKLFGQEKNLGLLKDLLQSILTDIQIKKIEIDKDITLDRRLIDDKYGVLDILATINDGTKINIEMQVDDNKNTIDRSLFYGTGIYHESLKSGQDYIENPPLISIWITNYNIFNEGPFHERAMLRRDYEYILLTKSLELHYIQLPKFKEKCKRISNKLEEWLTFIINENVEEIKMSENENIRKAQEELEYLTGDAERRRRAFLIEKGRRDREAAIAGATRRGKEEGIKENKIETAKKMLAKNINIDLISEITGFTKEEITNIKAKM